jgi:putative SOS response-associated peptidase YedK
MQIEIASRTIELFEETDQVLLRWGLVPYWAKDFNVGFANINAKAEGSRTSRPSARPSSGTAALSR